MKPPTVTVDTVVPPTGHPTVVMQTTCGLEEETSHWPEP
jgi:hypothetical protein